MFQPFAVETRSGPHVSLQASASRAGRYWSVTARSSLKARVLRNRPWSASAEKVGDGIRLVGGPTVVLDPIRPMGALRDPVAAAVSGAAFGCLVVQHSQQLLGYTERFWAVPSEWYPTNRVLLAGRSESQLLLDDRWNLIDAKGAWDRHPVCFEPSGQRHSPDMSAVDLPDPVRELLDRRRADAWLGVITNSGVGVLPCCWMQSLGVVLPLLPAAHMAPSLPGEVCLMMDHSQSRRPDQKRGVMLRGQGTVVERSETELVVALRPTRITYWNGFDSGTLPVA